MQHSNGFRDFLIQSRRMSSRSQVKVTSQGQLGSDALSACGRLTFFVPPTHTLLYIFVTFPSEDGRARLVVSVSSSVSRRVAALLCRLACLRVRPFRQSRRTRVSSPINTARVSLFAISNVLSTVTFITLYV